MKPTIASTPTLAQRRRSRGLSTVEYAIAGAVITAGVVFSFSDLGVAVAARINNIATLVGDSGVGNSGSDPAPDSGSSGSNGDQVSAGGDSTSGSGSTGSDNAPSPADASKGKSDAAKESAPGQQKKTK